MQAITLRTEQFLWPLLFIVYNILFCGVFIFERIHLWILILYIITFSLYQCFLYQAIIHNSFLALIKRYPLITSAWFIGLSIQFVWVFMLKQEKLELEFLPALCGYLLLVFGAVFYEFLYVVLLKICLPLPRMRFFQVPIFICILVFTKSFTQKHFFLFLGQDKAYNLINPLLPLFAVFTNNNLPVHCVHDGDHLFINLPRFANVSDIDLAQLKINQLFSAMMRFKQNYTLQHKVFLAPESFLQYDLEQVVGVDELFMSALGDCDRLCIGAWNKIDDGSYQSLWTMGSTSSRMMHKKLLCPLFEEHFFKAHSDPLYLDRLISFGGKTYLIILCSELFLANQEKFWPKTDGVIVFVKEKFFPAYFYKIMLTHAMFTSFFYNREITWIDYSGLRIIKFLVP